jgi:2,6-dihydroxypseudooxynicotine hydrolase
MSREILDRVWSASSIRLIGDGVPAGDVMAAQATLTHWDEWFPYWSRLGDTYDTLAREALARNRRQSAGELLWQACLSHHYAQFLWFHDPARRDEGQMRKVALYREAAPLFAAPAIRFDEPLDDFVIPGYLRLPPEVSGRVPVVIVLGGLESTKEESYRFENLCLARGDLHFRWTGAG